MHGHTCKSLLNTLGAVEQLAGCLAKQAKSQQLRSKYMTGSKQVFPFSRQWHQVTPIAPPTGCGIQPVPNRNLNTSVAVFNKPQLHNIRCRVQTHTARAIFAAVKPTQALTTLSTFSASVVHIKFVASFIPWSCFSRKPAG